MLPRRQRVSPAARIALVKKYLASGLTQRELCQQQKLAYPTFLAWLRKYRAAESQAPDLSPAAPSFVPLQLEPAAHRAASCTLEFPSGVLVHLSGDIETQLRPQNGKRWFKATHDYLIPHKALAKIMRRKFRSAFKACWNVIVPPRRQLLCSPATIMKKPSYSQTQRTQNEKAQTSLSITLW